MSRKVFWLVAAVLAAAGLAGACDGGGGDGDGDGDCDPGCEGGPCGPGQWATICAGSFTMGSPEGELDRGDDEPRHEVTLTHDFAIHTTEVTQADYEALMGHNPSTLTDCPDCPVGNVTWGQAAAYCNKLSEAEGLGLCYSCVEGGTDWTCEPNSSFRSPYGCSGYRLPTAAEWEYAARAGTTGTTYGSDVELIAWCFDNSSDQARPIAGLESNPWGLFDMLGNISEWCHDWYDAYPVDPVTDPWGPESGTERAHRGGDYNTHCQYIRTARRRHSDPGSNPLRIGFRPTRTLRL